MSNATTDLNHTIVNTKPNDEMKNAKRWESLLNALLGQFNYLFGAGLDGGGGGGGTACFGVSRGSCDL